MNETTLRAIKELLGEENVKENEPLKDHSTMKVGGPAAYLITPDRLDRLVWTVKHLKDGGCGFIVKGNGSNIIFRDEGYDGVILDLGKLQRVSVREDLVYAECGALLKDISNAAYEASLTGFEFACGIPGTLGGAVYMNAGAYGGEIKDVISTVVVLTEDDQIIEKTANEMKFGYRTSSVKDENEIVLAAALKLEPGNKAEIGEKIEDFNRQRAEKQPLEYPSCGSTFKRPEGHFAGKLITDAGMKGYVHGGAQVSDKHAGFIINKDNASAKDVLELIDIVKKNVLEKEGVELECEVKII